MSTAYFDVCCRSGGNNMNAGTLTGDTTVPGTGANVTYTSGDSTANAASFTAAGGSDMTEAVAGRYACLYIDGDTTPTTGRYTIAKISSVAGTTINLSTTERVTFGTVVGAGTGTRSLKIGGAWAGPNGVNTVPFTLALSNLCSTKPTRINFRNDVTYSVTANVSINGAGLVGTIRGFTTAYGDGGKATLDGGTSGAAYILITFGSSGDICHVQDMIFNHNGATSDAQLVQISSNGVFFKGCVFANSRGNGVSNSLNCTLTECEIYGCNASNSETAGVANFSTIFMNRCTIHDNAGNATDGVKNSGNCFMVECVVDTNGKHGVESTGTGSHLTMVRCDIYNNTSTGLTATAASVLLDSCNFVKNAGTAIAGPSSAGVNTYTINCAIGSGTQANASSSTNYVIEESEATLAANTTPWTDPANGDFSIGASSAAIGAGRGTFTATAAGYSSTSSSPCRSAAQRDATAAATDYPAAGNVRSGVTYNSGGSTGTLVVPSKFDVRQGISFDSSSVLVGLLVAPDPAAADGGDGEDGGPQFIDRTVTNTVNVSTGGCPRVGEGGLVL